MTSHEAWRALLAAHSDGRTLEGQVVSLVPFGAFVECAKGIHGLLHKSECLTTPELGSTISVRILEIDPVNRRFSLTPA